MAIRIFVLPKNEGIDFILPVVIEGIKADFFLNLLSHISQAGIAALPACHVSEGKPALLR